MGSRRSGWGGLLVALTATAAGAQEARRVRLALEDGTVVEGRLEAYADRTYRVTLADGRTRQVPEREVRRVDFEPAAAADAPAGAREVLADVVRRAAASGVLARRVGGPLLLACVEEQAARETIPASRRESLLAVSARADAAAGLLVVDVELRLPAGRTSCPSFLTDFEARGPARYRWSFDLAGGQLRRLEAWSAKVDLDVTVTGATTHVVHRVGDQLREGDQPTSPLQYVPLELLAFVLAPLHDQGLPASLAVPSVRGRAGARLRLLPSGGAERTVELAQERDGEPTGDVLSVVVGPGGLVRLEGVAVEYRDGVRFIGERIAGERLTREAWDARAAALGAAPPPTGPARPDAPAPVAQGPLPALLVAATLPGERWFATRHHDGVVTLDRVVWRRTGSELTFELHSERVGDPEGTALEACTWDGAGGLLGLRARRHHRGVLLEAEGRVERGRLLVRRTLTLPGVPPHTEELAMALLPGTLLDGAARFGLPSLGRAVSSRLDLAVVELDEVTLEVTELALEPVEGGLRLSDRASSGRTIPRWLVTLGADGAPRSVGRDPSLLDAMPGARAPEVDPDGALAVTAAEAAALRADPAVVSAGQRGARETAERAAALALGKLHRSQARFRATDADHDGAPDFAADLDELKAAGVLDPALQGGLVRGYRVLVCRAQDAPEERWLAVADPVEPGPGARSLAITQDGVVLAGPGPFAPLPDDARAPAGASPLEAR